MKLPFIVALASVTVLASAGCANRYAAVPPPPPAPYQVPALVQVATDNGFRAGENDGARDGYDRLPFRARSTRAYFDTPGYSGNLGPFGAYQNAYRLAYLRGYEKGFRHA